MLIVQKDEVLINGTASGNWQSRNEIRSGDPIYINQYSTNFVEFKEFINSCDKDQAATFYFDLGFNVFPVQPRSKEPYDKWGLLKASRIAKLNFDRLFHQNNIAVLCGKTSMNLFIVDCDTQESTRMMSQNLGDRAKWKEKTSRGAHFWFLSSDGAVANYKGNGFEIRGNDQYVLVPPSVHPSGEVYWWESLEGELPPSLSKEEIKTYFPFATVITSSHTHLPNQLPPVAQKVLVDKSIGDYASNSEAEYAAVLSMMQDGYDDDKIVELFEEYQPPHYSKRGKGERWFRENMIEQALEKGNFKDSSNDTVCDAIENRINNQPWPGRTGGTDRKVALALVSRARMENVENFRASKREIAELANVSDKTAYRSIHRLASNNFVSIQEKVETGYRYTFGCDVQSYPSINTRRINTGGFTIHPKHDAFHPRALGASGCQILNCLLQARNNIDGLTKSQIYRETGRSRTTVSLKLEQLRFFGLVENHGRYWMGHSIDNDMLDIVAMVCQTSGKLDEKYLLHKKERELYVFRKYCWPILRSMKSR